MFIRFVVGSDGEDHRRLTGVVTEASLLKRNGGLDEHEVAWVDETFDWLNAHLPTPPFSASGWPTDVVCWFKEGAREAIQRMWGIVALLREKGLPVRVMRANSPGKVIYEDSYQVVVEEWKRI